MLSVRSWLRRQRVFRDVRYAHVKDMAGIWELSLEASDETSISVSSKKHWKMGGEYT